jgi:hypothetical protein
MQINNQTTATPQRKKRFAGNAIASAAIAAITWIAWPTLGSDPCLDQAAHPPRHPELQKLLARQQASGDAHSAMYRSRLAQIANAAGQQDAEELRARMDYLSEQHVRQIAFYAQQNFDEYKSACLRVINSASR